MLLIAVIILFVLLTVGVLFFSAIFALTGLPRDRREEGLLVVAVSAVIALYVVVHFGLGLAGLVTAAVVLWLYYRWYMSDGEPWHPGLLDPPGYGQESDVSMADEREDRVLSINPKPLGLVSAGQRDVWFTTPEHRARQRAAEGVSWGRYARPDQHWIREEFPCHPSRRAQLALPNDEDVRRCPECDKLWQVRVEPWEGEAVVGETLHLRVTWQPVAIRTT